MSTKRVADDAGGLLSAGDPFLQAYKVARQEPSASLLGAASYLSTYGAGTTAYKVFGGAACLTQEERNGGILVHYYSELHNGTPFNGSCHACCTQLKLADGLFLALQTRGRSHSGLIHIKFSPPTPAGDNASTNSSTRTPSYLSPPYSYSQWLAAWGPDVTTASQVLEGNKGQAVLPGCGVTVSFQPHGRSHTARLLVRDAPLQYPACRMCGVVDLGRVRESSA